MIGRAYMRAASSAVASVAIATVAILAMGPVIGANADPVEPCDPVQDPQCAVVTVTVTQTPPVTPSGAASPTAEPVVTKTVTITPTPKPTKTKTPKPAATTTAPPASTTEQDLPPQNTQTLPSLNEVSTPSPTPSPEDVGQVQLPQASASPDVAQQTPTAGASFEQPDPETVPIEIRNASPEYDKPTLAHRLAIPAGVLVGIALIAWLIFEGRLRRMAHAAAVRRGGPAAARTAAPEPAAYPAATPGYAPMVGFVPVQHYTMGYPQQPYGYPVPYGYAQPYGYPPADPAQMQAQQQAQGQQQYPAPADPWAEATGAGEDPGSRR
ncbi:hypothetical protein [Microbispora sp. H13382]|uniref:hypothetical protein n=1 Tax=Microbispora sp. H13382 TaxID=2729112 RepID=UPI0016021DD6|nr:hypothetical protein [Microbispora sp. H13382]